MNYVRFGFSERQAHPAGTVQSASEAVVTIQDGKEGSPQKSID